MSVAFGYPIHNSRRENSPYSGAGVAARRAVWRSVLVAWLLCAGPAGCVWLRSGNPQAEAAAQHLAEQARLAADEGDLDRARALLAQAVAANPEDPRLHRERAQLMMCGGDCRAALEHLEYAAEQDPDDPAVFVELAAAYVAHGDEEAAGQAAGAALARDPEHVPALVLAAGLAERRGDEAAALALYHRVLRSDAGHSAARLAIAGIHLRRNRLGRAVPLLRAVGQDTNAAPADRVRALRELGLVLSHDNRPDAAAEACAAAALLAVTPRIETASGDPPAVAYGHSTDARGGSLRR